MGQYFPYKYSNPELKTSRLTLYVTVTRAVSRKRQRPQLLEKIFLNGAHQKSCQQRSPPVLFFMNPS